MPADPHDQEVASRATRPSDQDVAIAEEAILAALAEGRVAHGMNMIEVVTARLADEPTPELFAKLQDVTEDECRAAWTAATAMTALANLQWTGQLIPCDSLEVPNLPQLALQWRSSHGAGLVRNMQPEYAFPIGRQLRIAPWLKAVGPDSLALLRAAVPGAGQKVTRVLRESAEAYRRGLNVAAATLLGVGSEAAWAELATAIRDRTADAELASLLDSDRSRAAALAARCVELLPSLTPYAGPRLRRLATDAAHLRDLRDHAVHEPEGRFEEELFTRAAVGVELQAAVDYFRRIYGAVTAVRGSPS